MSRIHAVEAALASWRDAERRLAGAVNGDVEALQAEVSRRRDEYQHASDEQAADRRAADRGAGQPSAEDARVREHVA